MHMERRKKKNVLCNDTPPHFVYSYKIKDNSDTLSD